MEKAQPSRLMRYMDKKLLIKLDAGRHVQGILRGVDPFMNIVLDKTVEFTKDGQTNNIGIVVIRGTSIMMLTVLN